MRLHLDNQATGSTAAAGPTASPQKASEGSNRTGFGIGTGGAQDSVALSGPSAALGRLAADRAARVQQLSAAVRSGSYSVPSAAISGALIRHSTS